MYCSSAKPMPTRTRRSTSTTTTFLPGRRQPNTSSAGGIGASPIWAATTPIFSPPTAGAAIRRRWRWRISPSRGLLRGNADAGQRRRGRARAAQPRDRPTAIVVSDDLLGMTLGRACLAHGLSIPKDISIISFNNSLFAKLTSPPAHVGGSQFLSVGHRGGQPAHQPHRASGIDGDQEHHPAPHRRAGELPRSLIARPSFVKPESLQNKTRSLLR